MSVYALVADHLAVVGPDCVNEMAALAGAILSRLEDIGTIHGRDVERRWRNELADIIANGHTDGPPPTTKPAPPG